MWLVVYKQEYYPSVYECETRGEAEIIYNKIKAKELYDEGKLVEAVAEECKLYITKIEESVGNNTEDVDWYVGGRP